MLGRRENSAGQMLNNEYPHPDYHGLGFYDVLELLGAKAAVTDLDDHHRLVAGGVLVGLNLAYHRKTPALPLERVFRERDL